MTLAAAVQLLTTALMLLQIVNANPSLPQAMRDQAQSVAQNAITEATKTLGGQTTASQTTSSIPTTSYVSPSASVVIRSFRASPTQVTSGPATLSWSSSGATHCSIFRKESNGGLNTVQGNVGTDGSFNVYPGAIGSAEYVLVCYAPDPGTGKDAPSAQKSVTVSLAQSSQASPSCILTSEKPSYDYGETLTFSWASSNATYAEWVPDASGKDNIQVPGDKLAASGFASFSWNGYGNPSVTLRVHNSSGQTATCTKTVSVQ